LTNEPITNTFEKLVSLAKRRGFVFQSSEIYGGMSAIYDYGHYGTLLKDNIRNSWLKTMVQQNDNVYGLDSAIFMHPRTWLASGHIEGFNDPQVDCKKCKNRMRADTLLESYNIKGDKQPLEYINKELDRLRVSKKLKCPSCGSTNLTQAKVFSLMVKSNLGSPTEELSEENVVYLRPETCGGIYLDYKNTLDALHPKLPFGIAQVGKAFRNEIVARQFIFRTREFEQMEMQYFHSPKETKKDYEVWKKKRWNWYLGIGFPAKTLKWHKHEKLAHYATEAYDIEYDFKSLGGFYEIEGIHTRGDWDLSQHSKFSGVDLTYTDPISGKSFMPHVLETSAGLNRILLAVLDLAYSEEKVGTEERILMKFPYDLAPIKIAVFPLLKNKPALVKKAREVFDILRNEYMCEFDDNGNIGKRYRRQDEIGTPLCVTVDFDSIKDNAVTVRDRDTMKQERVKISGLIDYTKKYLNS
jgi:glycyl-tRNA synthetase